MKFENYRTCLFGIFFYQNGNFSVIPLGILEPPFFQLNRPNVFNYGSLGSLIGHEISHALDTTGRRADKNGKITNWWADTDIFEYETRANCFENLYNKFGVDGSATLGENIADTIGVKISLRALENLATNQYYVVVPKLEEYTKQQLFFMSFAQSWCEISNEVEFLSVDEHSPVKQRVLGTLYNTEEFQKAFSCTNTKDKCTLW